MKLTTSVVLVLVTALSTSAYAERHRAFAHGARYVSNGKFGLGLELGEPTGLNGKYFLSSDTALNFGVGDLYHNFYVDGAGFHLYLDHLWHPVELTSGETFKLPFYVGVGGRAWFFDCKGCSGAAVFGIRVPLGIAFDFNEVPLDLFAQFVPTFDFYRNYANRAFYLDVDFSLGIRYWFS